MFDFRSLPPVVKNLILINGLFYLGTILLHSQGIDLSNYLGLHYWESPGFKPHQLVSYMFLHAIIDPSDGSILFRHILGNMFALFIFGRALEQVWRAKRFLIFYVVTGIGAGLIQMIVAYIRIAALGGAVTPETTDLIITKGYQAVLEGMNFTDPFLANLNGLVNGVTVGASGAVFGILLAFGMLFPNREIMLMIPPIPVKAKWLVLGYGVYELYAGFANNPNDNVAHFAHLGGALVGFILLKIWKQDRSSFY